MINNLLDDGFYIYIQKLPSPLHIVSEHFDSRAVKTSPLNKPFIKNS